MERLVALKYQHSHQFLFEVFAKRWHHARRTPEVSRWHRLGRWNKIVASSHLTPGLFNSRVLCCCLAPLCSHPPQWPFQQRRFANCDWMLASFTSGQPSHPRRHPTCWVRRKRATLFLTHLATGAWAPVPSALTCPPSGNARRLKSRHPSVRAAQQHSSFDHNNIRAALWTDHWWYAEWLNNTTRLRTFNPDTGTHPPGIALQEQRGSSLTASGPRTGVGRFRSCLHKESMAPSAACECGTEEQTVDHVVLQCPIHRPPHGLHDLPMDWRFWMMRQSNGCSTVALRCSVAYQWIERTRSKDTKNH